MNKKRSTKAEMVGVDDLMPQILWMRFLENQGFKVSDNIIDQDDKISTNLKKKD